MPSRTGSVQARTPGAPSTATRQLGHWPAQQRRPRRRWYLNEREKVRWPVAKRAEPIVSPSSPLTARPSNVNVTSVSRSMRSPRCLEGDAAGRVLDHAALPPAARGGVGCPRAFSEYIVTCAVQCTSFVRVLRSAMNHSPQPERCSHHSCCTPATLSAEVVVPAEVAEARGLLRARVQLSAEGEVGYLSDTAVRAGEYVRHESDEPLRHLKQICLIDQPDGTPGIQLVPASGTRAIAAASTLSATRSSGSRLWRCDFPHARASVCASSVIVRR